MLSVTVYSFLVCPFDWSKPSLVGIKKRAQTANSRPFHYKKKDKFGNNLINIYISRFHRIKKEYAVLLFTKKQLMIYN